MSLKSSDVGRVTAETFVRTVELHDELPSTSDRAIELSAEPGVELPLLVLAERQTAGRGRGENRWWSAPGGLTFSLLLRLDPERLPQERWPQISLAAGLAVAELLSVLAPQADVRLKWPNDVFLDGRKVCGILVEVPAAGAGRIVVGVGLNVNNSLESAPADVREAAVSLCEAAGRTFELLDVLVPLLQAIDRQLAWLAEGASGLPQRWESFCLLRGRLVHISQHRETSTGLCQGIDADGALLLATPDGVRRFVSGTVR